MSSSSAVNSEDEEAQRTRIHFVESSTTPTLSKRREVMRCLILALILLSLAISISSVIIGLLLYPRVPVIQITSLSVSNMSLLPRNVRADAEMGFTVVNNHIWTKYLWFSGFDVFLRYKNHEISNSYFKAFILTKGNETSKNVKFAAANKEGSDAEEDQENIAAEMSTDLKSNDLSFKVCMKGFVFIPYAKNYSKKKSLDVLCKDLKMEFSENGNGKLSSDQKYDCSVRFA